MMRIRPACDSDIETILAITNEAIANTTSVWNVNPASLDARRLWMQERQAAGFPVLVVDMQGVVVGFGSFGSFRAWEGFCHTVEHSLYIEPSWQGRGLGRALLDALVAEARARRLHAMVAGIEASNVASLALHRRAGFVETGRLPEVGRKFDRWLDLVFMQRIL